MWGKAVARDSTLAGVAFLVCLTAAATAKSNVINFDDLNSSGGTVPANYGGLVWNGWDVQGPAYQNVYGNPPFPSSPNAAVDISGTTLVSIPTGVFNVDGAYFSSWVIGGNYISISATQLTLTGLLNGQAVAGPVLINLGPTFAWTALNMHGIDTIQMVGSGSPSIAGFLMDNFTYAIPEPMTLLLLGSGIWALGIRYPRR